MNVAKFVALAAPEEAVDVVLAICNAFRLTGNCERMYGRKAMGAVVVQVLAAADVNGYDGQVVYSFYFY